MRVSGKREEGRREGAFNPRVYSLLKAFHLNLLDRQSTFDGIAAAAGTPVATRLNPSPDGVQDPVLWP